MLDYQEESCAGCGEKTLVYNQYIGDSCCESCGEWQEDIESDRDSEQA